jgi:hypothetical protein
MIWRYLFKGGVWKCQILNQVAESQLFTSLWNRYHQWMSDIELIQMRAFSAFYSKINSCFTAGKQIVVWTCTQLSDAKKATFTSIVYVNDWERDDRGANTSRPAFNDSRVPWLFFLLFFEGELPPPTLAWVMCRIYEHHHMYLIQSAMWPTILGMPYSNNQSLWNPSRFQTGKTWSI